jgi:hypothetical protein
MKLPGLLLVSFWLQLLQVVVLQVVLLVVP